MSSVAHAFGCVQLSRTVTVWLFVGMVWAAAFAWKTSLGTLTAFEFLLYYAILRSCEAVMSIGGLAAIVPSKWIYFMPDWMFAAICCCCPASLSKAEDHRRRSGSVALPSNSAKSRGSPNQHSPVRRAMSLSSDIKAVGAADSPTNGGKPPKTPAVSAADVELGVVQTKTANGGHSVLNPVHPAVRRESSGASIHN